MWERLKMLIGRKIMKKVENIIDKVETKTIQIAEANKSLCGWYEEIYNV